MGWGRAACCFMVEGMDWINVALDTIQWQVFVNVVKLGSMKGGDFLGWLCCWYLLKKDSVPLNWLLVGILAVGTF